jgi:hypothetical protein
VGQSRGPSFLLGVDVERLDRFLELGVLVEDDHEWLFAGQGAAVASVEIVAGLHLLVDGVDQGDGFVRFGEQSDDVGIKCGSW